MMLYLELFTELDYHRVVEISTISSNNSLWHTIPTDQIMSDKPRYNVLGYCSKGSCFNPLCEIINSYQNEAIPVRRIGLISPIMSMPHIAKGQGAVKTFRGTGGTCTLSA